MKQSPEFTVNPYEAARFSSVQPGPVSKEEEVEDELDVSSYEVSMPKG